MTEIIQPKSKSFGLYIYFPENVMISLENFPAKISQNFNLDKFAKNSSASCNSPTYLFVSGRVGEKNRNLWIIDKVNYSTYKKILLFDKANHSMIYINGKNNHPSPNFNEAVFILGGNDTKTFYYDVEKKIFVSGEIFMFKQREGSGGSQGVEEEDQNIIVDNEDNYDTNENVENIDGYGKENVNDDEGEIQGQEEMMME